VISVVARLVRAYAAIGGRDNRTRKHVPNASRIGRLRCGGDSYIAPGLYHTGGSGSAFGVWINNVPTQDSMCSWFTYSTPDANKDHVLQTNTSVGPMFANINSSVKAFESQNCQPWTRVP